MSDTGNDNQFFRTKIGVIAATVGSAVGLGNIWRFPYETGNNGGAAFIFIYIFFVFAIGVPAICAEFVIGRSTRRNIAGAFRELNAGFPWNFPAYSGLLASFLIMGFYPVVAGWTLYYLYESVAGFGAVTDTAALHARFDAFTASPWQSTLCTVAFLAVNFFVISRGVSKGIERISSILMPLLVLILVAFCLNSFFMPGAAEGLAFMFRPDFSSITPSTVLCAMGQAFFSLSVGMGVLATYASYFNAETRLVRTATITAVCDTIVAILAGIMIFPAVFSFGMQPEAGPRLVFEVLPSIFLQLPLGNLWSALFFLLLFVASLTSTISMTEVSTAWLMQEWKLTRNRAVLVNASIVVVMAIVCTLSFGPLSDITLFGRNFFSMADYAVSNILMPLGGMFICAFVGWKLDRHILRVQLSGKMKIDVPFYFRLIVFSLRYIAPAGIFLVFIFGLM